MSDHAIAIAALLTAAVSTAISAWQGWMTNQAERRRHQPLLILAELGAAYESGAWTYQVGLRNEGAGTAFRTTFGIEVGDRRYAYSAKPSGPAGRGDVPRALPADRTERAYTLEGIPGGAPLADGTNPDPKRRYWTRCENTLGEVWFTSNPVAPDPDGFQNFRTRRWRP